MKREGRAGSTRLGWTPRLVAVAFVVAGCLAATDEAQAQAGRPGRQAVRGVIRDDSGRPLAAASLTVVGQAAPTESREDGTFVLPPLPAGPATIVARRLGFAPETLQVVDAAVRLAPVQITLRRLSARLDAVRVIGRKEIRGRLAGFYARQERGNGRFFTQEQIEKRGATRMSDLLRGIPGLRVEARPRGVQQFRLRGAAIAPLVWLDGTPMGAGEVDLDNFDPRSFAAIEVYAGPSTVPAEFAGSRLMSTSGGAVLLWTKEGQAGPPRRKRGAPSPTMLIAGLLERGEVFPADAVDVPTRLSGPNPLVPIYPDSLYNARASGEVEVEFVVDSRGRVRMDTFGVVATTHRSLGESVRRSLDGRIFEPATRRGLPVGQLVLLPFSFQPDSGVQLRRTRP